MYFAIFDVTPAAKTPEAERYLSAHVCCWINRRGRVIARGKARVMIRKNGWEIRHLVEEKVIGKGFYSKDHPALERFEQALTDGEVLEFYAVPRKKAKKTRGK